MKFVQKLMQIGRSKIHFQQLDAEPRIAGSPSSILPGNFKSFEMETSSNYFIH